MIILSILLGLWLNVASTHQIRSYRDSETKEMRETRKVKNNDRKRTGIFVIKLNTELNKYRHNNTI